MKNQQILKTLCFLTLFGIFSIGSFAQCNVGNGGTGLTWSINPTYICQSFTATCSGQLTAIYIPSWVSAGAISIRSGHGPNGIVLYSQSSPVISGATHTLTTPINVTNGSSYTIRLENAGASPKFPGCPNCYSGGAFWYSTNGGASWRYYGATMDLRFNITISTPPPPTPAGALDFDGISDKVALPVSNSISQLNQFTVETWAYVTSSTNHSTLYSEANSGSLNPMLSIIRLTNGKFEIVLRDNANVGLITNNTNGTMPVNTWTHVAFVRTSSTTAKLYINGTLTDAFTFTAPSSWTVNTRNIGVRQRLNYEYHFNGQMDEVRIWNRALCQTELQNNMNCELTGSESGLAGYYNFNNANAFVGANNAGQTTLSDNTSNGNDGTLIGFALNGTTSNWTTQASTVSGSCSSPVIPEINITGNGQNITDGQTATSTTDGTDFGSTLQNTPVEHTFTIENSGIAPLNVTGVTLSGANASEFTVTQQPPATVAANGGTATFKIRYDAANIGTHNATANVASDDCDENPYDFSITATTTATAPEINITGNGQSITDGQTATSTTDGTDFGSTSQNTPVEHTFTIENSGTAPLNVTGVTLSGANAGAFTVTQQPPATVAANGGTATFKIRYDAANAGTHNATVNVANNDSDENPYDFSITATTTASAAGALDMGGTSDYVAVGSLGTINDFTIETWFKPDGASNFENVFHTQFPASGSSNIGVRLEISQTYWAGHLYLSISGNGQWAPYTLIPLSSTLSNNWQHIAIVGDKSNNNVKVYLDGSLVINTSHNNWPSGFGNLQLGRGFSQDINRNFKGKIDEFRIWSKARTQAEIQADMNCELAGNECNLLVYYNFNNSNAYVGQNNTGQTTVTDISGNGHNGTLSNFALNGTTSNWTTQASTVSGNCSAASCTIQWTGTTSTDWNEATNWNPNGVPTATDDISIDGSLTNQPALSGLVANSVNSITFTNNATVDIGASASLTVNGDVTGAGTFTGSGALKFSSGTHTLNDPIKVHGVIEVPGGATLISNGNLTLEDGASLMHGAGTPGGGGSVTGDVVVKRNAATVSTAFNLFGSPVSNANAGVLGSTVYYFNESNNDATDFRNDWQQVSGTLTPGLGYTAAGAGTVTFSGPVNNGNISVAVTHTTSSNPLQDGWNCVGNPYPSSLDAADFLQANQGINPTENLYLWDNPSGVGQNGFTDGDYATYNRTSGFVAGARPNHNAFNGEIASCQGMFIKVNNSGTISFTNAMRGTGNKEFFREAAPDVARFKIGVSSPDGMYNETMISFKPDATEGYDIAYDALKMKGSAALALYTELNNEPYAIQAFPVPGEKPKAVPLVLEATETGMYTFAVQLIDRISPDIEIWLEDRQTGNLQDLRMHPTYSCQVTAGIYKDRFIVHFNPVKTEGTTGIGETSAGMLSVYGHGDRIYVRSRTPEAGVLKVYNILGEKLAEEVIKGATELRLQAAGGVYLVTLQTATGTYSRKVAIMK